MKQCCHAATEVQRLISQFIFIPPPAYMCSLFLSFFITSASTCRLSLSLGNRRTESLVQNALIYSGSENTFLVLLNLSLCSFDSSKTEFGNIMQNKKILSDVHYLYVKQVFVVDNSYFPYLFSFFPITQSLN